MKTPELIIYLTMNHVGKFATELSLFERMIAIRLLNISHNNLEYVNAKVFQTMLNLLLFDLSYNKITTIPEYFFCPFEKLKYLYINNNQLVFIYENIFSNKLKLIMMENNQLDPLEVEITGTYPFIDYFSSDIPRFGCIFEDIKTCFPPFPTFISCQNLISSKLQVAIAWFAGISTSCLNLACLCALIFVIAKNIKKLSRSILAIIISFNLCFAEMLISACLLSYSFINVYYFGYFGIMADEWRNSIQCYLLECLFSVSVQASLVFSAFITAHFAVNVTSLKRRETNPKRMFVIIMLLWLFVILICSVGQLAQTIGEIDELNYFCLPFVTSQASNSILLGFHCVLLVLDFLCVFTCICLNFYLFLYFMKHSRDTKSMAKQTKIKKFTKRMVALVLTNTGTWLPVLIVQIISLYGYHVLPAIFLWILIISFSFNLILDPILVLQSVWRMLTSK